MFVVWGCMPAVAITNVAGITYMHAHPIVRDPLLSPAAAGGEAVATAIEPLPWLRPPGKSGTRCCWRRRGPALHASDPFLWPYQTDTK